MGKSTEELEMVRSTPGMREDVQEAIDGFLANFEDGDDENIEKKEKPSEELLTQVWRIHHKYAKGIEDWRVSRRMMNGIRLYINMDVKACDFLSQTAKGEIDRPFLFEAKEAGLPENWNSKHDGRSLLRFIPHDFDSVTEFFEKNVELFSKNTQGFINMVDYERHFEPTPSLLRNEFEYKVFLAWLDENLDYEKAKRAFNYFRERAARGTRMRAMLYFAKAIESKYCDFVAGSESTRLFASGVISLHTLIANRIRPELKHPEAEEIEEVIAPIRKEERILDAFFNYSTRLNTSKEMAGFLSRIATKKDHWDKLESLGFTKEETCS